jgi:hypothetical protein
MPVDLVDHYTVDVNQIEIREGFSVVLDGRFLDDAALGPDLVSGDVVAVAIDRRRRAMLARVADVTNLDEKQRVILVEHIANQQSLGRSSNPLSSARWTRFLKELKKCGSDHDNKKRKTLLHVIRMAKAREAIPESIQLTVRRYPEDAEELLDVDVVAGIQAAIDEAAIQGDRGPLDLYDVEKLLQNEVVVVDDAEHAPIQRELGAKTFVMNGVSFERGVDGEWIESITISAEDLRQALYFNTEPESEDPESEDRDRILDDVWDGWLSSNRERLFMSVYSHNTRVMVYQNKPVKNIKKLSNRDYTIELEASLYAGRLAGVSDTALVTITSYQAVGNDIINEPVLALTPQILLIHPDMYEFKSVSNTNETPWLEINFDYLVEQLMSQFEKDETYFVSVDGIHHAVARVESVTNDPVKQSVGVEFSYQGGALLEARSGDELLRMKRAFLASPKVSAAMMLTLERSDDTDGPDTTPDTAFPDDVSADLEEMAANIDELVQDDLDKYVSLSEVADWIAEKELPNLKVTGAEYVAPQHAYETSSSVSGGIDIEIWASKNGESWFIDLEPRDLANWQSVVHRSRFAAAAVEAEPGQADQIMSEVRNRLVVEIMEEVKRQIMAQEVDPSKQQAGVFLSIYSEELYSEEGGYAVCNNEAIYKILRKKKDGKCIYRIVVKKGARANRIYHGTHRKCVMYIDRKFV